MSEAGCSESWVFVWSGLFRKQVITVCWVFDQSRLFRKQVITVCWVFVQSRLLRQQVITVCWVFVKSRLHRQQVITVCWVFDQSRLLRQQVITVCWVFVKSRLHRQQVITVCWVFVQSRLLHRQQVITVCWVYVKSKLLRLEVITVGRLGLICSRDLPLVSWLCTWCIEISLKVRPCPQVSKCMWLGHIMWLNDCWVAASYQGYFAGEAFRSFSSLHFLFLLGMMVGGSSCVLAMDRFLIAFCVWFCNQYRLSVVGVQI